MSTSRWVIVVTAALALAACAGHARRHTDRTASTAASASTSRTGTTPASTGGSVAMVPPGRMIVHFRRLTGIDPYATDLSVNTRGAGVAVQTVGGLAGQKRQAFTLSASSLSRLLDLVRQTRLHDTWCCSARSDIYYVYIHDHAWRLQQGHVPRPIRPLMAELNALMNAHTIWN